MTIGLALAFSVIAGLLKQGIQTVFGLWITTALGILMAFLLSMLHQPYAVGTHHVKGIITQVQPEQKAIRQFTVMQGFTTWSLTWYSWHPDIHLGDCWDFQVKVKSNHSLHNPYQLFQSAASFSLRYKGSVISATPCQSRSMVHYLSKWRGSIDQAINQSWLNDDAKRVVRALAIGRPDQLTDPERSVLARTGTSHLFAISGLHLTTVAILVYHLAAFIGWCFPWVYHFIPKPSLRHLCACVFALAYSFLVGFSLPVQRASFMLFGYALSQYCHRPLSGWQLLHLCCLTFILLQPGSILLPSFWLSFISVAVLLYTFNSRLGLKKGVSSWLRGLWVAWIGTLGLNILFFQQISLCSMLGNALAIPVVTLSIVPLLLIGVILYYVSVPLGIGCWYLATEIMSWLWIGLTKLAAWPWAAVSISHYHSEITLLLIAASMVYLLPHYFHYAYWGWALIVMSLLNRPPNLNEGTFECHVVDVGQGLSVIIRTKHHALLYDTGPRYLNYDLGAMVVVPYLRWLNIRSLDHIIVSHWDSDHSGGLRSILSQIPAGKLWSSDQGKSPIPIDYCLRGTQWRWDGVDFKFLYPSSQLFHLGNNSSCVLQIKTGSQNVLIPGDIEAFAEKVLLENPDELKSQVLVAPHHGSKTSSTIPFIEAVDPDWVLFTVGAQNRFGLPKPMVVQRYVDNAVNLLRSDKNGAIQMTVSPNQLTVVQTLSKP